LRKKDKDKIAKDYYMIDINLDSSDTIIYKKFKIILKYISSRSYESMDLETFTNELEMRE
jgi:hypothetical protein